MTMSAKRGRSSSSSRFLWPAFVIVVALTNKKRNRGFLVNASSSPPFPGGVSHPSHRVLPISWLTKMETTATTVIEVMAPTDAPSVTGIKGGDNIKPRRRRWNLSRTASIDDADRATAASSVRGGGGGDGLEILLCPPPISSVSSVLLKSTSTLLSIIATSFNVASGAFVFSGYFGACIASWMIRSIQNDILPNLMVKVMTNEVNSNNGGVNVESASTNNNMLLQLFEGKYRWTSMATLLSLLLHITLVMPSSYNNIHGLIDDVSFTTILWIYSHTVDPILGGAIGMAHVALAASSTILGHNRLLDAITRFGGKWRLQKLNQYFMGGRG